jgi:hypothetical protein
MRVGELEIETFVELLRNCIRAELNQRERMSSALAIDSGKKAIIAPLEPIPMPPEDEPVVLGRKVGELRGMDVTRALREELSRLLEAWAGRKR